MKAFVGMITEVGTLGTLGKQSWNVLYLDAGAWVETYNMDIGFDDTVKDTDIRGLIETGILAHAAAMSYSMTAADIIYSIPTRPPRACANPTRTLNSAFQISTSRDAEVAYSINILCSSTALAGQKGRATLKYADDSGITTNVVSVGEIENSTAALLGLANGNTQVLAGTIPVGKWAIIVPGQITGTPTITFVRSQEVLI